MVANEASLIADGFIRNETQRLRRQCVKALPPQSPADLLVVRSRVKSEQSLFRKRRRKGIDFVSDFIGLRVVTPSRDSKPRILDAVLEWSSSAELTSLRVETKNDVAVLHHGIHVDFRFPHESLLQSAGLGVEVQIMTTLEDYVSAWSHQTLYGHEADPEVRRYLARIEAQLHTLDEYLDELSEIIQRQPPRSFPIDGDAR